MTTYNCLTCNIRGLNDNRKVRLVQSYLVRHNVDKCFLQETHLSSPSTSLLQHRHWGNIYLDTYSNYARGTAILLRKNIGWSQFSLQADPDGRYIILEGALGTTRVVLVTVYGSNSDSSDFFHTLWGNVLKLDCDTIIWEGGL